MQVTRWFVGINTLDFGGEMVMVDQFDLWRDPELFPDAGV